MLENAGQNAFLQRGKRETYLLTYLLTNLRPKTSYDQLADSTKTRPRGFV